MASIELRTDWDAARTRWAARAAGDGDQVRRLLAIAAVYEGLSREDAARLGGMDRQTLRDWVHRFNDEGPEGLVNRPAPGNARRLTPAQEGELAPSAPASGPATARAPANITLLALPPRSPELNPAENVWAYLRLRWLSNHIFADYDAILVAVCDAWNRLIAEPDRIASIGSRQWATIGQD